MLHPDGKTPWREWKVELLPDVDAVCPNLANKVPSYSVCVVGEEMFMYFLGDMGVGLDVRGVYNKRSNSNPKRKKKLASEENYRQKTVRP